MWEQKESNADAWYLRVKSVFSERPDLDERVASTRNKIRVHVSKFLNGAGMSVGEQARMLHARPVVNLRIMPSVDTESSTG